MSLNLEHTTIHTNGVDLHVVLAGPAEGEPLILLHGFPEFWRGWLKQIEPLTQAGYRLIIPDQRGYNLSAAPKAVSAYAMHELVEDVIGLLDHFELEKTNLVGHDWGAAVAWSVALRHPERISRLGILNVPHPVVMAKFLSSSPRQMLKSWYIGFFQIPALADWLMGLNRFWGAIALLKASGTPTTFSAADLEEYRAAYKNSGGLTGMINWYRALLRFPPARFASLQLQMPVLILWGQKDVALSAEMARKSLELCKHGQLVFFEQATHWVQHDAAEAVSEQLLRFLCS